ncbi:hypothetical protein [Mycobacteroides abscessus]|uniref:hypothetical protein n=1 Tax=Mycobacteroides abscessus TaxID=36809 RepID=UPI001054B62D|nr:hypothetical protein [Mycobacteroides abscessus]
MTVPPAVFVDISRSPLAYCSAYVLGFYRCLLVLVAGAGVVREDSPVSRASFDVGALAGGITELRQAAETVRTAGLGLRCPGLSLFAITERLWVFSARVESLVRNLVAGEQYRVQLLAFGRPQRAWASADGQEMLVPLDLPVTSSYAPTPGHPLSARLDELGLAADMIVAIGETLGKAATVDELGIPLLNIGELVDLVLDLRRDIDTLSRCDPGEVVAEPAGWDNL